MSNIIKYLQIFFPMIAAIFLIPINLGIKSVMLPSAIVTDNQGVLISIAIILIALLIGMFGLSTFKGMAWYIKLMIAVLYIPTVVFSLLISGM